MLMELLKTGFKEYVVGLLFRRAIHNGIMDYEVCLISKTKPLWQRGFKNAIGGKLEPSLEESAKEAQIREFKEETGADFTNWQDLAVMYFNDCSVYFFAGFDSDNSVNVSSPTEEKVEWFSIYEIKNNAVKVIPNLKWLIPAAIELLNLENSDLTLPNTTVLFSPVRNKI